MLVFDVRYNIRLEEEDSHIPTVMQSLVFKSPGIMHLIWKQTIICNGWYVNSVALESNSHKNQNFPFFNAGGGGGGVGEVHALWNICNKLR